MKAAQEMSEGVPWVDNLDHCMTKQEDEFIREYWMTMPDSACYMDAFFHFLNGTV